VEEAYLLAGLLLARKQRPEVEVLAGAEHMFPKDGKTLQRWPPAVAKMKADALLRLHLGDKRVATAAPRVPGSGPAGAHGSHRFAIPAQTFWRQLLCGEPNKVSVTFSHLFTSKRLLTPLFFPAETPAHAGAARPESTAPSKEEGQGRLSELANRFAEPGP
jgi:hypothetical protein